MHEDNGNMSNPTDVQEENGPRSQCDSQQSNSQDLSETSINESIQELTDCLPNWVTRNQMITLLKDSSSNVVEAVSNFYEHETEYHAVATATTSSDSVNPLGKDSESPCKLSEYESASPFNPNSIKLATGIQPCKLSSMVNFKKDNVVSPVKRRSASKNKQSKKSRVKLNVEKQHTITKFFSKMAPLDSKGNSDETRFGNECHDGTAMNKESEMYKDVVDQFIRVVNTGDKLLRSQALTFVEKAKGNLDVALELYHTHSGIEGTEKDISRETVQLLPSQSDRRVGSSG